MNQNTKAFLIGTILVFPLLLLLLPLFSVFTFAGSSDNVSGWAWSEHIGWISLNSTNQASAINYGVNINPADGNFTGWAWSERVGWLSFQPTDVVGCPGGGSCQARLNFSTNQVIGWARFLAGSGASGWDGWVSLNCVNQAWCGTSNYKVTRSSSSLTGWAWGGVVVGWIQFSGSTFTSQLSSGVSQGATITVEATNLDGTRFFGPLAVQITGPTNFTTTDAPQTVGVAAGSYTLTYLSGGPAGGGGVIANPNQSITADQGNNLTITFIYTNPPAQPADPGGGAGAPTTSQVTGDTSFFCPSNTVRFVWSYSDPNGNPQGAYDLEIYNDSALTSLRFSTGTRVSPDTFYVSTAGSIPFSGTFWWRVRVRDSNGAWSEWSLTNSFTTPPTCIVNDFSLASSQDIFVNIAKQQVTRQKHPLIPLASAQLLERSSSATITVIVPPLAVFTDPVSFSVVPPPPTGFCTGSQILGLPVGASVVFSPTPLTQTQYSSGTQFYVEVLDTTPEGIYCIDVRGQGGSPILVRDIRVLLSVILKDPRFKEF